MKITKEQFVNWYGECDDEQIDYILSLLNGEFSIESARSEILQYNEE